MGWNSDDCWSTNMDEAIPPPQKKNREKKKKETRIGSIILLMRAERSAPEPLVAPGKRADA